MDSITQWQVESYVEEISEAFLLPALVLVVKQFPYMIKGFHSNNSSKHINLKVEKSLEKLRIGQTKSRPLHSNENAPAESKNASVVRKHMGYAHIPKKYAKVIAQFYQKIFNPSLNLHRPCMLANFKTNAKSKVVSTYQHDDIKTLSETLKILEKQGFAKLKTVSVQTELLMETKCKTDLTAAEEMQRKKSELFNSFIKQKHRT